MIFKSKLRRRIESEIQNLVKAKAEASNKKLSFKHPYPKEYFTYDRIEHELEHDIALLKRQIYPVEK